MTGASVPVPRPVVADGVVTVDMVSRTCLFDLMMMLTRSRIVCGRRRTASWRTIRAMSVPRCRRCMRLVLAATTLPVVRLCRVAVWRFGLIAVLVLRSLWVSRVFGRGSQLTGLAVGF
jgi:hypothetical protein